jgi:hypothetical protein
MTELVALHPKTGVGDSGEYLHPSKDRQVGLGILGLANYLALNSITYAELAAAFDYLFSDGVTGIPDASLTGAVDLVLTLEQAIMSAAHIARKAEMDRAFAIAPTANCSYNSKDLVGNTATPEIAPPISRIVDRDSETLGVETYSYGEVEIASEVGWDVYYRVCNGIAQLFKSTGLFHGYSFNSWSDVVTYDEEFVGKWLDSPQTSLYYSLPVMSDTQDKSSAMAAMDDYLMYWAPTEQNECMACRE